MSSLALIVLNWNGADDAMACLESLLAQKPASPDIYLVDNASSDDSVARLETFIASHQDASIHFIKNDHNAGFAGGINLGIKAALENNYDFIGTLNPDATAGPDWANNLVNELRTHDDVGIATGILARSDHTLVDSTGDRYTTWGIPGPRGRDTPLTDAPKNNEYIFAATGGGFIAKTKVFETIGLFDEKFFMYYEDVDFGFRAQLAGFRARYVPSAIAYHKVSASTNKVPGLAVTQTFKNLPVLFLKNVPLPLWSEIWPRFTLAYLLIFGNAVKNGRGAYALKGWIKSLGLLPHALKERHLIQSTRKVSVNYIDSIILRGIPPEQTGLRKFRKIFTGK